MSLETPGGRRRDNRPPKPPPAPPARRKRTWWRRVGTQVVVALLVQLAVVLVGVGVRQILRQPAAAPTAAVAPPAAPASADAFLDAQDRLEADLDALLTDATRGLLPPQQDRVRQLRQVHGDRQLLAQLPRWLRDAGADLPPDLRPRLDRLRAEADRLAAGVPGTP